MSQVLFKFWFYYFKKHKLARHGGVHLQSKCSWRLRQEEHEFKPSPSNLARPCVKRKQKAQREDPGFTSQYCNNQLGAASWPAVWVLRACEN